MIPRLRSNLPLFEAAVVASLLGIGWALVYVSGNLEDLQRRPPAAVPRPELRRVVQLTTLVALREQYAVMAQGLADGMGRLRDRLAAYDRDRSGAVAPYLRSVGELHQLLGQSGEALARAAGRVPSADWPAHFPLRTNVAGAAVVEPGPFLAQLRAAVSNYVAALNIDEATPLSQDIIQRKLSRAEREEEAVRAGVRAARLKAEAIDQFLEGNAVEWVTPAGPAGRGDDTVSEFKAANELTLRCLIGVFLLLAIVLIVSVYRRVVVVPLHHRMIEHSASAEYQRKLDHFARVATGLAHEIRNPLTAIGIRLFTLQKALPLDGTARSDALLIRAEIERLEQIVKNFLHLARPSEPRLAPIQAGPLLEETRALLAEQYRPQGTELVVASETSAMVMGDASQLKQVLINLVQNAAESIGGPGRVTLRAYETRERLLRSGGDAPADSVVVLEVKDTGGGIAPENQERLFDPFFSTKENGTGLGLPIAAKIADQHRGRVEFESRPGEGATFRVILPTVSQRSLHG